MKKILLAALVFISVNGYSQLQKPNTRGYEFRNLVIDSFFALPSDTFSVPSDLRTFPFTATKGTSLYKWNVSTFKWDPTLGGGGGTNSNIGSGYRWAVPGTNNIKTSFPGYGILKDSTSNTNSITDKLDTATVFPAIRATIPGNRFGYPGEDDTFNEDRNVDANGNGFYVTNTSSSKLSTTNATVLTSLVTNGADARIEASNLSNDHATVIVASPDSLDLRPHNGVASIDSLRMWTNPSDTINKKPMTWDVVTKRWEVAPSWFGGGGSSSGLTIGTTSISSGTAGRVLFQGSGNVVQQSSNLFWDQSNSRLGLGTASPDSTLTVETGILVKRGVRFPGLTSGANTDSVVTANSSGTLFRKAMTVINTASRDSGDIIQWNGSQNVYVPPPSGSANLLGAMVFKTGVTENAPAAGDSVTTNTYFVGKKIFVYREGLRQDSASTDGYTFNNSTGALTFHPPLMANERVQVDVYDVASVYYIAVQAPASPPVDLTFTTRYEFTNSGTVMLQGSGAGQNDGTLNHAAIDNLYIAANTSGRIFCKFVTGENNFLLGFNTTNTNQFYTDYEAALYIDGSSVIKKWESGAFSGSYGTASNNIYYGIYRDGATGTIKLQSSTSASDWSSATDLTTLSYTTTAAIYLCATVRGDVTSKITNPQAIGAQ